MTTDVWSFMKTVMVVVKAKDKFKSELAMTAFTFSSGT